MKYDENIQELGVLLPDYMGFIFFEKSSRFVGETLNRDALQQLPKSIKKVGVFVNASEEYIAHQIDKYSLDLIQLHGNETVDFCETLKKKNIAIIKAFQIDSTFDFQKLNPYKKLVNYFLFDTKTDGFGGSGKKFNWKILQQYDNEISFFLSGGISAEDVLEIKNNPILKNLKIESLDINSRFETAPAMKNVPLISEFIKQLKNEL